MNIIKLILEIIGKVFAAKAKPVEEKESFPEFEIIDSTKTLPWHETRTLYVCKKREEQK